MIIEQTNAGLLNIPEINLGYILENREKAIHSYPHLFRRQTEIIEIEQKNNLHKQGFIENIKYQAQRLNEREMEHHSFVEDFDIFHSLIDFPDFIPQKAKFIVSIHDVSFNLFPNNFR